MSDIGSVGKDLIIWIFQGPASQLWPMLVIPAVAALVSDRAARRLPPTRADWRIAALLAASPGIAMLTLMGMIFSRAIRHMEWGEGAEHFMLYQGTAIVAAGLLAFALARAALRHHHVRELTAMASAPSPRLATAAAAAGVKVRELAEGSCEIFVAGIVRPTVFVSSGALQRMGNEELAAALHHEAAHVANRDPALFSLLAFLRDLAPSTDRAMTAFAQARERIADAQAANSAGSLALALALIAAVKPAQHKLPVPGMGGTGSADWRLRAILGVEPAERSAPRTSLKVWSGLAANILLAAWPAGHIYVAYLLCC
jgi:Zn-dependent protease with chaperone function